MKILLATTRNPHFATITEYVEKAIRALGHDLVSFDDRRLLFPGRLRATVPALHRLAIWRMNRRLVALVRHAQPDLLLCMGGERLQPAAVEASRARGTATVLWTVDAVKANDPRIRLAAHFDHVFCGGSEMLVALAGRPVRRKPAWLPFGCDPDAHHPVVLAEEERQRYGHDLVFVGSLHPGMYDRRVSMLEALADFDLGVWGPGASALPPGSPIRSKVRGEEAPPEVWTRLYSAAKIVLCAHYDGPGPRSMQASPRVFEALACGAFLLCDDTPDVCALFEDGTDLAIFRDTAELREKARYFSKHAERRAEIAERGRRHALAEHTYVHRVRRLVEAVAAAT